MNQTLEKRCDSKVHRVDIDLVEALKLRKEGHTFKEIATILKVKVPTLMYQLERAPKVKVTTVRAEVSAVRTLVPAPEFLISDKESLGATARKYRDMADEYPQLAKKSEGWASPVLEV